mgnify:FL=1
MARFETKFISQTLLRSVEMTVIIPSPTIPESLGVADRPASYEVKDPYPVLYLLHGLGNDHSDWTSYTNVELFAEEQSMAVIMISAENKFYRKNADGDDFFHFLSEEVPAFIKGMFPVSNRPEDTYIAGLSMGGYGAMIHGLNHPERFAASEPFPQQSEPRMNRRKISFRTDPLTHTDSFVRMWQKERRSLPYIFPVVCRICFGKRYAIMKNSWKRTAWM